MKSLGTDIRDTQETFWFYAGPGEQKAKEKQRMGQWVTVEEAVELGIGSSASIKRWIRDGSIPSYKNFGGVRVVWAGKDKGSRMERLELQMAEANELTARAVGELGELHELLTKSIEGCSECRARVKARTKLEEIHGLVKGPALPPTEDGEVMVEATFPPEPPPFDRHKLLASVLKLWSGSDQALDRAAGLPRGWTSKRRRGDGFVAGVEANWEKLMSFYEELQKKGKDPLQAK